MMSTPAGEVELSSEGHPETQFGAKNDENLELFC